MRAGLLAGAALLALVPGAAAAPGTFPAPGLPGVSVTLGDTTVVPGQRVPISGTGFVPASGNGSPLIAVKPYDIDVPSWGSGGTDRYEKTTEALIWFAAAQPGGGWSGWVDIGADLPRQGLGTGADAGSHWLRILSGAFATDGADTPGAGSVTPPITYKVPFDVADRLTLGLTAGAAFQEGTTFRPGTGPGGAVPAQLTLRGRSFAPEQTATVTLDGAPVPTSPQALTTNAEGDLAETARALLPVSTAVGTHTLTVATGAVTASKTITVTAPATAALVTPSVRPGSRFAVRVAGFTGVGGAGQKVAVVVNEAVLACLQADAAGAGRGTAVLPAGTALGTASVGFAVGTSCKGPSGPVDDLPNARVGASLAVSETAPAVQAAAEAAKGGPLAVSGAGFAPGPVAVTLDGVPLAATLTAGGDGAFSGTLTVPADAAIGERTLLFTAGESSAVATFTATAPPTPATTTGTAATPPAPQPQPAAPPAPAGPSGPAVKAPGVSRVALRGRRLTLTLTGRAAAKAAITVRTAGKVRATPKAKPRVLTLARGTTGRVGKVTLTVTKEGDRVLRRAGRLKVVVRVMAPGRPATSRTVTLRRA